LVKGLLQQLIYFKLNLKLGYLKKQLEHLKLEQQLEQLKQGLLI